MNKITVIDNKINLDTDDKLKIDIIDKNELFNIKKIKINVIDNTEITLDLKSDKIKLDLELLTNENIKCKLFEFHEDKKIKIQNKYLLKANSELNIIKFYDSEDVKELDIIELNGEKAKINYELKTIATKEQKYDMIVYHNFKETESYIKNKGVNIKGGLHFNVTGIVENNITDCIIDQKNRIINMSNDKCTIDPKLLIEENDVIANHSALIGKFSDDELFYLMSRGISEKEATILLVKGFLMDNIEDEELNKKIEKYWR